MGNLEGSDDLGNMSDDNPALEGDYTRTFRVEITEVDPDPRENDIVPALCDAIDGYLSEPVNLCSSDESSVGRNSSDESFDFTIVGEGVVVAVLRRLFAKVDVSNNRLPVLLGHLKHTLVDALICAGVPGAELCAAVDRAEKKYYDWLARAVPAYLPADLGEIYRSLRDRSGSPTRRHLRVYPTGSRWGYAGPVIVVGKNPLTDEYYLSLAPDDPNFLVIGRRPLWPGQYPEVRISLQDKDAAFFRLY
jgi:hypothetical protein